MGPSLYLTAWLLRRRYYKLDIDGVRVSQHELGIFTTFAKRVLYHAWDATPALAQSACSGVGHGHESPASPARSLLPSSTCPMSHLPNLGRQVVMVHTSSESRSGTAGTPSPLSMPGLAPSCCASPLRRWALTAARAGCSTSSATRRGSSQAGRSPTTTFMAAKRTTRASKHPGGRLQGSMPRGGLGGGRGVLHQHVAWLRRCALTWAPRIVAQVEAGDGRAATKCKRRRIIARSVA